MESECQGVQASGLACDCDRNPVVLLYDQLGAVCIFGIGTDHYSNLYCFVYRTDFQKLVLDTVKAFEVLRSQIYSGKC